MKTARQFFEDTAPDGLVRASRGLPDDVVVVFHIEGPGGGCWQVEARDGRTELSTVEQERPGPKDCEVRCAEEDFMRMVEGDLSPKRAYLSGRLKVQGDIGLALRLQGILRAS